MGYSISLATSVNKLTKAKILTVRKIVFKLKLVTNCFVVNIYKRCIMFFQLSALSFSTLSMCNSRCIIGAKNTAVILKKATPLY